MHAEAVHVLHQHRHGRHVLAGVLGMSVSCSLSTSVACTCTSLQSTLMSCSFLNDSLIDANAGVPCSILHVQVDRLSNLKLCHRHSMI